MRIVGCCLITLFVNAASRGQTPLGTGITYQGQLQQNGASTEDTCDFQFSLWDDPDAGTQIGPPLTFDGQGGNPAPIAVSNGAFTVQLDFGAGAFIGEARWLEIAVACPSGGALTTLSPRQPITPAPYALFSLGGAGGGGGAWSVSGSNVFYTGGNVGIGTAAPTHRLRVSGGPLWTSNQWTGSLELDNAAAIAWRSNVAGRRFGIGQSTGGLYFFNSTSDPGTVGTPANYNMVIADGGNVGIGANTPAFKLTVNTPGYGFVQTNGGVELGTFATSTAGWFGTRSNHPLKFFTFDSLAQMTLSTAGNLGVGVDIPASRVDIAAQDGLRITGYQPFLTLRDSNAGNARGVIQNANGELNFWTNASLATGTPALKLYNNGVASVRVLQVLGADLAEKFPTAETDVEPGTVMEIDPEHEGQLRIARNAYSGLVAGVVSGAGDLSVGAVLGNLPGHEDAPPIALSGRVWVRCDPGAAAIAPGDLLTTSQTPGHAMKAVDHDRSHGAILGKAMTALAAREKGLVLVLVNLQ